MAYFAFDGTCLAGAYLIPPLFGFSLATLALSAAVNAIGRAFAFEGIMKTWAQESFPTLLRATAQGTVIAIARYLAAAFALTHAPSHREGGTVQQTCHKHPDRTSAVPRVGNPDLAPFHRMCRPGTTAGAVTGFATVLHRPPDPAFERSRGSS
ncbi:hypothetical protein [Streptomyces sp. NPDC046727]|uniref:hypothetical protein n=1 Tax=Streptomyces sp. NPDC046727 TaxID=3155373 RepID=UPI0033E75B27